MCVSGKTGGADAVGDAEDGIERLRDRPQDSPPAPQEEDGSPRTRPAHGLSPAPALDLRQERLFPTLPTLVGRRIPEVIHAFLYMIEAMIIGSMST